MKKVAIISAFILILGLIGLVLLENKAKMAVKAKTFSLTSFPVLVMTLSKQDFGNTLSQVGVITANSDVAVVSETQGKIKAVRVKVGSIVVVGTPLLEVDDELPKAQMLTAEVNYHKAKKDLERQESLHHDAVISDTELESTRLAYQAAESQYTVARRQYDNAYITAPISGVISAVPVEVGVMITPGTIIANIVDIKRLKVKLNVAEEDAFQLKVGDPAEITTSIYPGVTFQGVIDSISAKGDEAHTYPVEVRFNNSAQCPLKAGMFGRVNFKGMSGEKVILIPREALVGSVKEPEVFIIKDGVAHLRKLVIGAEQGTDLVVRQGLSEGETIVTNGQENLEDNVPVTVMKD
jgi:RND family efflux transporter MFP subunit